MMSSGELFLTVVVAFVVIKKKKLPMLARHLGLLLATFNRYKQTMMDYWQQQMKELQLEENKRKALDSLQE